MTQLRVIVKKKMNSLPFFLSFLQKMFSYEGLLIHCLCLRLFCYLLSVSVIHSYLPLSHSHLFCR